MLYIEFVYLRTLLNGLFLVENSVIPYLVAEKWARRKFLLFAYPNESLSVVNYEDLRTLGQAYQKSYGNGMMLRVSNETNDRCMRPRQIRCQSSHSTFKVPPEVCQNC